MVNDEKVIERVHSELKAFPEGQHDDIVDTFAYGYNYFHMKRGWVGVDVVEL